MAPTTSVCDGSRVTTGLESLVFWVEANKWVLRRLLRQISGQIRGGGFDDRSFLFSFFFSVGSCLSPLMKISISYVELSSPSVGIVSLYLGEFLLNLYG